MDLVHFGHAPLSVPLFTNVGTAVDGTHSIELAHIVFSPCGGDVADRARVVGRNGYPKKDRCQLKGTIRASIDIPR